MDLSQKLIETQKELEKLKAEYHDFTYKVSHDLNASFRSIDSFSNFILESNYNNLDEKAKKHFSFIINGSKKGKMILEGLLSFSKLNTEVESINPIDSKKVLERVLAELCATLGMPRVNIYIEDLPHIYGQKSKVEAIFYQLLKNAFIFRKEGSLPDISVSCIDKKDFWCFSVRDNGIGIDSKHHGRIFNTLTRAVSDKEYPGVGMGLAISKKAIELHGGTIFVESEKGRGAIFSFTLPKLPNG